MGDYNSRGGRGGGRPEMFDAVCDECGDDCEVPFRPTSGKPIYCSDCFEDQESELYDAVCDDCGNKCQLPFKPSRDKDVYCSDCFENRGNSRESSREYQSQESGMTIEHFEVLNNKLDYIIRAVSGAGGSKPKSKQKVRSKYKSKYKSKR